MTVASGHNPDILTCLANLSADEVFTPPKLASAMLDLLPQDLFKRPETTFLDPVCKSGVFLREIARRLNEGLKDRIPDEQARIDHILTKQVFGLAITELTGQLARRSVYCTKKADGQYSIASKGAFSRPDGNIRLPKAEHNWNENGRCEDCGASEGEYDRDEALETYAYPFIHGIDPTKEFKVKFDVIVGNPPYQLSDGGFGRSASPIYQHFIAQAKKLQPRFLLMVIPSRWFAGGKGLDEFRAEMLADRRIRRLTDFESASDVFPGVDIAGGVCYFLWVRDDSGDCEVTNVRGDSRTTAVRVLNESATFIRHSEAAEIVKKIQAKAEPNMADLVSSAKPFGLRTFARPMAKGDLILRWHSGEGPFPRSEVTVGQDWIDKWKVITSKVSYDHAGMPDKNGMRKVFSILDLAPPKTICTETYLVVGCYDKKAHAENMLHYLKTRFVRFLVAQVAFSQDIFKGKFQLVPSLDMSRRWTDADLAERYELAADEVAFIESKIRPWE
jgi:site-specific DNA-methyltransferase (adenine-specific)